MPLAPFDQITATYTGLHAWMYETIVAPAVYSSRGVIDDRFLTSLPTGAHILDLGSGGGLFTNYIADQRPDVDIIGVDLSLAAGATGHQTHARLLRSGPLPAWRRHSTSFRRLRF